MKPLQIVTPMKVLLAWMPAALLLSACAANPTGGVNFVLMSESAEIAKGRELHEELLQNMPVYNDPELTAYVNDIGQRLAANSHRPDLEYHFTIIDSPDINAFALPGGYIYINRGLMAYLNSEAQLAAVLGHELAHVTARHAVRQDAAGKGSNILAGLMVFTTGVRELGETTALLGGTLVSGYGREMELEADGLGAEYLYNTGYDPSAIVDVITVLKNQEDFNKKVSGQASSYHGLFATHPRNDTRLLQAVNSVGKLEEKDAVEVDPAVFREQMTGLPLGQTQQTARTQDRNRYYQNLLNYTMVFPDEWKHEETPTTITTTAPDGSASLRVEVQRRSQNTDARTFIRDNLGISGLQQTEAISQFGLQGYTGILADSGERLAVIHYGARAFIFRGSNSEDVMASIRSFRPILRNEQASANPPSIQYIQADGRMRYADLAASSRIAQHGEDVLRLLNGHYPNGEPKAGEWIKIVR